MLIQLFEYPTGKPIGYYGAAAVSGRDLPDLAAALERLGCHSDRTLVITEEVSLSTFRTFSQALSPDLISDRTREILSRLGIDDPEMIRRASDELEDHYASKQFSGVSDDIWTQDEADRTLGFSTAAKLVQLNVMSLFNQTEQEVVFRERTVGKERFLLLKPRLTEQTKVTAETTALLRYARRSFVSPFGHATPLEQVIGWIRVLQTAIGSYRPSRRVTTQATAVIAAVGFTLLLYTLGVSHLPFFSDYTFLDLSKLVDATGNLPALQPDAFAPTIAGLFVWLRPATLAPAAQSPVDRAAAVLARHVSQELALAEGDSSVDAIQKFLAHAGTILRKGAAPVPQGLLSVEQYHGPYSRDSLTASGWEESYAEVFVGGVRTTVRGIAEQVGVSPEQLGLSALEAFASDLYWARDANGRLLLGAWEDPMMFGLTYRVIPQLLVPALADPSINRGRLQQVLRVPLKLSNDRGNDAMCGVIGQLINGPNSRFIDDPKLLKGNPHLLIDWIKLSTAANVFDLGHKENRERIEKLGVKQYVLDVTNTPFLPQLGGEWFLYQLVQRVSYVDGWWVFLPDNNIQLAASMKLAEIMLSVNPKLKIAMIVKADGGAYNDGSIRDARRLLRPRDGVPDLYKTLRQYREDGRFRFVIGSRVLGTAPNLLPESALRWLRKAKGIFAEGEANALYLNGVANAEIFLGLRLKWPLMVEDIFGLRFPEQIRLQHPPAVLCVNGAKGPYFTPLGASASPKRTIMQTLTEAAPDGPETVTAIGGGPARNPLRGLRDPEVGHVIEQVIRSYNRQHEGEDRVDEDALSVVLRVLARHADNPAAGIAEVYREIADMRQSDNPFGNAFNNHTFLAQIKPQHDLGIIAPWISADRNPDVRLIVDIGAGTNAHAPNIRTLNPDAEIIGCDIRDYAEELGMPKSTDPRIGFRVQRSSDKLPFEDGTVDRATKNHIMHHAGENVLALAKATYDALKVGGLLVVLEDGWSESQRPTDSLEVLDAFFTLSTDAQRYEVVAFLDWWMNHLVKGVFAMPMPESHQTLEGWVDLYTKVGFKVVHAAFLGFAKRPASPLARNPQLLLVLEKPGGNVPESEISGLSSAHPESASVAVQVSPADGQSSSLRAGSADTEQRIVAEAPYVDLAGDEVISTGVWIGEQDIPRSLLPVGTSQSPTEPSPVVEREGDSHDRFHSAEHLRPVTWVIPASALTEQNFDLRQWNGADVVFYIRQGLDGREDIIRLEVLKQVHKGFRFAMIDGDGLRDYIHERRPLVMLGNQVDYGGELDAVDTDAFVPLVMTGGVISLTATLDTANITAEKLRAIQRKLSHA